MSGEDTTDEPKMPKIEFPCRYPIKVIGAIEDASVPEVIDVVRRHAPEVTPDEINTRKSRAGNFQSVRITIQATGEPQLKALHRDLMQLGYVKMVL